ncbi:MAG: flagellar basal-body MS-ring/collar protein FliF [Thiogranum sp.]|nr:flagellar basal-body MS-ring/collar protein FliF [Thiogranum sp.]
MALVRAETVEGFQRLPALRQIGLMIGLAASIALGIAAAMWSQKPDYTLLYANLSSKDAGAVIDALQKSGIGFEVDQVTGAVMVASDQLHNARMQLAKDGLPEGSSIGFEILQKDQGFGTSQSMETARFQRALEGELSRTIATLRNVKGARVHLAIPKRSVFLRDRAETTASVMIDLYSGRSLEEEQVGAIVHLVSSSVPHLKPGNVTVVDQSGNLLSDGASSNSMAPSSSQFSYNRKLEATYAERIRKLLEPMVGVGRVRATINADLDFTVTERTEETYNPDLPSLRSEQVSEDQSSSSNGASGIPGALSNQPPEGGTLQRPAAGDSLAGEQNPGNSSTRRVRNYELDKTISHTKLATGSIRRLSIAVVIDDKQQTDGAGDAGSATWSDEELDQFTTLIKEAVGFSVRRGDSVNVMSSSFIRAPVAEAIPDLPLLEQPWVWDAAKKAAGAIAFLLIVFAVLKPVMRSLAEKGAQPMPAMAGAGGIGEDQLSLSGGGAGRAQLDGPRAGYDRQLENARMVVSDDPKRVAQVVKNWVAEDG